METIGGTFPASELRRKTSSGSEGLRGGATSLGWVWGNRNGGRHGRRGKKDGTWNSCAGFPWESLFKYSFEQESFFMS